MEFLVLLWKWRISQVLENHWCLKSRNPQKSSTFTTKLIWNTLMISFVKEVFTQSHETPAKKWEAILKESFSTQPFWFMIKVWGFTFNHILPSVYPGMRGTNRVFPALRFNFDKKSVTVGLAGWLWRRWRCYVRICMSYGALARTVGSRCWQSGGHIISRQLVLQARIDQLPHCSEQVRPSFM